MQFAKRHWFFILLTAYTLLSLLWLTRFPFVHSDESWLSGLTRQMMALKSFQVTEPFFDLYPRNPHAIKLLFHTLQMPWILTLGYSIFSVRLMSLFFGILALITFRRILIRLELSSTASSLGALLLGASSQFVYASHTARQEIVVLCFMFLALERLLADHPKTGAAISAAGLWLHPNGFIAAAILVFVTFILKKRALPMVILTHTLSLILIIAASLALDPQFFTHYLSYGDTLEVTADAASRLENFRDFYLKLYHRISATYYNANILPWLTALPAVALLDLLRRRQRDSYVGVTAIFVLNAALFAIGRYNPTSILFAFPWVILILTGVLEQPEQFERSHSFSKFRNYSVMGLPLRYGLLILMIAFSAFGTAQEVRETAADNYTQYLNRIKAVIPSGSKVLGNLNTEYAFGPGALLDLRNLAFLEENDLTLASYIETRGIRYIILTDELAYIARNPKWNILYGDVSKWMPELNAILAERGVELLRFRDDTYSVRIARYVHTPQWYTTVYELK